MWIILALISAFCLGFYDVFKKLSVRANNVIIVLWLNTLFGTLLMSPVIISNLCGGHFGLNDTLHGHLLIVIKALIVLGSWILGYFAIKHLPLTIQGPINATRPVVVLVGAMLIFGERLNWIQWIGITIGFASLYFISRLGSKEGFSLKKSNWIWLSIGSMILGAISALYDKYLLNTCGFLPTEVQAWYSLYQCLIMGIAVLILLRYHGARQKFVWRWSIPFISVFLTVADMAYFYSLSYPDALVAIVSMIRRGSVIVSFMYGVLVLHEKHIRSKLVDLLLLLISLALLILGAL